MATVAKSPPDPIKDIAAVIEKDSATLATVVDELSAIKQKLAEPVRAPWVTSGGVYQDSQPYSIMKAAAYCVGAIGRDQIKNEFDIHTRLKSLYAKMGWAPSVYGNSTFLMPLSSRSMCYPMTDVADEAQKLALEVRQKMTAMQGQFDPEEANWLYARTNPHFRQKALGTISDTAGGVLVGFPTLGELIDLQRNLEVFANAGATEIGLPPNGRLQFPKLTGGATAYWLGEAQQITASQETTGYLDLIAKKLGCMVKMNNELLRFTSPTAEGLVRMDMAKVNALTADLAMLQGTGGTQVKGLITYPTQSSWTVGNDSLILLTAGTTGNDGNTLLGTDINRMVEALPDQVSEPTAFVMRRALWSAIKNFRADAITTGDSRGQFLFSQMRTLDERPMNQLVGYPVIASSQVSTARVKGNGTNLTYLLTGYFPDWITARFGVMEFLATNLGDTSFQNDQTWLRGIQLLDAGPRHAASFVMIDSLTNNSGA